MQLKATPSKSKQAFLRKKKSCSSFIPKAKIRLMPTERCYSISSTSAVTVTAGVFHPQVSVCDDWHNGLCEFQ